MKRIFTTLIVSLCAHYQPMYAQNVAINNTGTVADPSAILDVTSTNRGIRIPNVALTAINVAGPVTTPVTSLLVYNTATAGAAPNTVRPGYYYWDGTIWVRLGLSREGWLLNGNTGITDPAAPATYGTSLIGAAENFLGTTDANDVVFATDNIERMRLKSATGNLGIGVANPTRKLHALSSLSAGIATILGENNYIGTTDNIGVQGVSVNNPGYGYGGVFTGGYRGIEVSGNGQGYAFEVLGINAFATGNANVGTRTAGRFSATGGLNNYAIISPFAQGRIGLGTTTPNLAHLQSHGMVGNTMAYFKGLNTDASAGISLVGDWPGLFFNSYYNAGFLSMASTGYSGVVSMNQGNGYMEFLNNGGVAHTAANAGVNFLNRMRIAADGRVVIGGFTGAGGLDPVADLTVHNPSAVDAIDAATETPVFTARHAGAAGTRWRMGSVEFYTEGYSNIGFTDKLCPLGSNGSASLGGTIGTRYSGFRWGTLYTTANPDVSSDMTLKKNIQNINYGIASLRKISTIAYNLKEEFANPRQKITNDADRTILIGFNAQELKQIIPEVVSSTTWVHTESENESQKAISDNLGVRYGELIPVTVNAIKELDAQQQKIISTINISDFGTATITNGELYIPFASSFAEKLQGTPTVVVTPTQPGVTAYISSITANGFTIKTNGAVASGVLVNYIAMAKVNETKMAIETKYSEAEHQAKLQRIAAYENSLPKAKDLIAARNARAPKPKTQQEINEAFVFKHDKEMIEAAKKAEAAQKEAAKKAQEEINKPRTQVSEN
jgi:hypothetical protein